MLLGPGCDIDINECARQTAGCDPAAACINTRGAFSCTCYSGYTGNGTSCQPTPALAGVEAQYSTEGRARLACDEGTDLVYPEGAPGYAYDETGSLERAAGGGQKVRLLLTKYWGLNDKAHQLSLQRHVPFSWSVL
jgi:mannan endo-1,4-beta-mannosidase